ncbi:MAG: MarR family transcriptional regulator [Kangiellaceae bacterium]|nr:MarR family transcriptional regulator [Kangiellaceae bacterium]MCW8997491.1 MarR family transcriptional regulator [Kangiellaceae bacterium]
MNDKYFEKLSSAFMAHFCRRLSDLIIEQGSELIAELNLVTPTTAVSSVFYLDKNPQATVAELANALGVSHQMATQRINQLTRLKLVERVSSTEDKRAKVINLTKLGKAEVKKLLPLTEQMTQAFDQLEEELGSELTKLIRRTELALIEKPLRERLKQT